MNPFSSCHPVPGAVLVLVCLLFPGTHASGREFVSPEIFVLGDSQITFGAGEPFVEMFENLNAQCGPYWDTRTRKQPFHRMSVGVMGIRSTSVHALTAREGRAKALVCEKDKKWGVNAGSYGVLHHPERRFEQVGEHPHNQFCRDGQSALEAMFDGGYYRPRLLVLFFLGNSAQRWAGNPELLARDVAALEDQLPPDMPCVFATSGPTYLAKKNALRRAAQDNFGRALASAGGRCAFVAGITPATIGEFEGNPRYFYKKKSGKVRDPTHHNKTGAKVFLEMRREGFCKAIEASLRPAPATITPAPRQAHTAKTPRQATVRRAPAYSQADPPAPQGAAPSAPKRTTPAARPGSNRHADISGE